MWDFIKDLSTYQEIPLMVYDDDKKMEDLIAKFEIPDLEDFLGMLDSLDKELSTDWVKIVNIQTIIAEDDFLAKLWIWEKQKIVNKIFDFLSDSKKNYSKYTRLYYWLLILLRKYSEALTLEQAEGLFANKSLKQRDPSWFKDYFRQNNVLKLYEKALFLELNKQSEDKTIYYDIWEEDILYLSGNIDLYKSFWEFLANSKNTEITMEIFHGRSLKYSPIDLDVFFKSLDWIIDDVWHTLEKIVKHILAFSKHSDVIYSHKKDVLSWKLFQELSAFLVKRRPDFLWDVLSLYDNIEMYIHSEHRYFFTNSLLPEQVEKFVKHPNVTKRGILDIYYRLDDSHRPEAIEVKNKFKEYEWALIAQSEKAAEESEKKNKEYIENEKSGIRQEIEVILKVLEETPSYSEKLLYLYEKHPDTFLQPELEVVKSQIESILASDSPFNPEKAEIKRDSENKNSFTWPVYMGNNTLERCISIWSGLWVDLLQYQHKLITYLPFTYSSTKIYDIVKTLTDEDVEYLISAYSKDRDQKDNLRLFHPSVLAELWKRWYFEWITPALKEGIVNDLKDLLEEDKEFVNIYLKKEIIETLWKADIGVSFFLKKLEEYIPDNMKWYNYFNDLLKGKIAEENAAENFDLWVTCNKVLIKVYNETAAIEWRLQQLKNIDVRENKPPVNQVYTPTSLGKELDWREEEKFYDPLKILIYPEYKEDIIEILKHAFSLPQKNNLAPEYLKSFVADYYKRSQDAAALIELRTQILDKKWWLDFFTFYLGRYLKWSADEIEKFILQETIFNQKSKIEELLTKSSSVEPIITPVNADIDNPDDVIIITEGESDRRHLCRAAEELLKKTKQKSRKSPYSALLKYIKRYERTMGDTEALNFVKCYAQLYPNRKVILIMDGDSESNICEKDWSPKPSKCVTWNTVLGIYNPLWKDKKSIDNCYVIILPHPDKTHKAYYDKKWVCIELYYHISDLTEFIVPRNLSFKWDWLTYFKYNKKRFYSRDVESSLKNIYDSNDNVPFFDTDCKALSSLKSTRLITKNQFAQAIYPNDPAKVMRPVNSKWTWNRFKSIFDLLNKVLSYK